MTAMRKILFPSIAVALLATSFGAYAATTPDTGVIKAIDAKAMTLTLTLADGIVYKLPEYFKVADLKVGEKVTVSWKLNGIQHEAETVVAAK
jgi:hypothetical protein